MKKTSSPSIDILLPSNLERFLYLICEDPSYISGLWSELKSNKVFTVNKEILTKIQSDFIVDFCNEKESQETIKSCFDDCKYLVDPHTSVAIKSYVNLSSKVKDLSNTVLIASTAHVFKFSTSVNKAISSDNSSSDYIKDTEELKKKAEELNKINNESNSNYIHQCFIDSLNKPVIHSTILKNSADEVKNQIVSLLKELN